MRSSRTLAAAFLVAASLALAGCGGGSGGAAPTPPPPPPPAPGPLGVIKHVVIVFQENRTPDNLFQGLAGADIATQGLDSQGHVVPLTKTSWVTNYDLGHSHPDFEAMYDGGHMDGADKIHVNCHVAPCPATPQFQYVDPAQTAPYLFLASHWTFGDRMFQSNQGPSFPAHQFIISGTSTPSDTGTYAGYFASENPTPLGGTGCVDAPANALVTLIDPLGQESASTFPCFDHATLIDRLDAAGLDWRYYTPSAGSIWTAPNAISHLRNGPDWAHVIIPPAQVLTDIAAGQLAAVTWVIPTAAASDHAYGTDGSGPDWVASVVNAVGASPFWKDTAVIVTWDDWGGWYDHVAPPIIGPYSDGFRVPLIVVSPYAHAAYVTHRVHDFGSVLHFIEQAFALPSLGYADAHSDDLADCFDFTQAPLPYVTVPTTIAAKTFVQRQRAGELGDPDDD